MGVRPELNAFQMHRMVIGYCDLRVVQCRRLSDAGVGVNFTLPTVIFYNLKRNSNVNCSVIFVLDLISVSVFVSVSLSVSFSFPLMEEIIASVYCECECALTGRLGRLEASQTVSAGVSADSCDRTGDHRRSVARRSAPAD